MFGDLPAKVIDKWVIDALLKFLFQEKKIQIMKIWVNEWMRDWIWMNEWMEKEIKEMIINFVRKRGKVERNQ